MEKIKKIDYDSLSNTDKVRLSNQLDNFLELLYLKPSFIKKEDLEIMKIREKKLREWKNIGSIFGFTINFANLCVLRLWRLRRLYFRNYSQYFFFSIIVGFYSGRLSEYYANKLYYRDYVYGLAEYYNITDDDIRELHKQNKGDLVFYDRESKKRINI